MNTKRLNYWVLLLLLSAGINTRAQYYPPLYCLAVKQQFSAWGDCGDNPYFRSAKAVLYSNSSFDLVLNERVVIPINYVNKGSKENVLLEEQFNKYKKVPNIQVNTSAGGILNDHYLTYELETLKAGVNTHSREASDPCSNNANWGGKREGYIMTTTVYVDDPIDLTCADPNPSYSAEEGTLSLSTGEYFVNWASEKPELQVALDNGEEGWSKIPAIVFISPNKSYVLKYEDIAGKKIDTTSNFFKWMGRRLKFRVVKTLLNDTKSVGEIASGIAFYLPLARTSTSVRLQQ